MLFHFPRIGIHGCVRIIRLLVLSEIHQPFHLLCGIFQKHRQATAFVAISRQWVFRRFLFLRQ